jgi:hypothetical protein
MNLAEILSQGESEGVEFKSSFNDEEFRGHHTHFRSILGR